MLISLPTSGVVTIARCTKALSPHLSLTTGSVILARPLISSQIKAKNTAPEQQNNYLKISGSNTTTPQLDTLKPTARLKSPSKPSPNSLPPA